MPFSLTSPQIPLDKIEWDATGTDVDPRARLVAHIRIGPLDMHLEAWELEPDDGNIQAVSPASWRSEGFDTIADVMECKFQPIDIDGRAYFLIATPYSA